MQKQIRPVILIVICLALIVSISNLILYFGVFDGDPLIHVAYAEHASQGEWFRFNPTEISSGVTSYLWMFVGALGWKLGGVTGCLFVYDALILLSWLGCAFLLYRMTIQWGGKSLFGLLAAALFLGFPGIGATGLTGMENMTFSFLFFLFIYAFHRFTSEGKEARSLFSGVILGILLGLQILIRPEGYVIAVVYAGFEMWTFWKASGGAERKEVFFRLFWTAVLALIVVSPVWVLHYNITGFLFPESGVARLMSARRAPTAIHLFGPIWLYSRTLARLVIYFPISSVLLYVAYRFLFRRGERGSQEGFLPINGSLKLAVFSIGAGLLLYSFGTGALHVNRYTIWILGITTSLFAVFLNRLLDSQGKRFRTAALAAVLVSIVIISSEAYFRFQRGDHLKLQGWDKIQSAVEGRQRQTDNLLALLAINGVDTERRPLGILIQEVQIRLCYDQRIKIVSRDGRTSDLNYTSSGCPHLRPLIESEEVQVIMDNINGGTLLGCLEDEWLLGLSRLYSKNDIHETEHWKKVFYDDFPDMMRWSDQQKRAVPLLFKK